MTVGNTIEVVDVPALTATRSWAGRSSRPHAAGRRRRRLRRLCSIRRPTPPRPRPGAPARGPTRCWWATDRRRTTSCCPRRSSSTTTRPSPPRARATCATPPRSTRSWPCGCSRSPTRRRPRPGAPMPAPRRSSTGGRTCRRRCGSGCTAPSDRSARARTRATRSSAPSPSRCRGGIRPSTARSTRGPTR